MLKEMIFLASYNVVGGSFGNILAQWEQMGVFSYVLPFLLIFAMVYGILVRLKLFTTKIDGGEKTNNTVNAIIALATGLLALQFQVVPLFFARLFPALGAGTAIILVILIVMGLFANPNNRTVYTILTWGSLFVAVIIVIYSLGVFNIFSGGPLSSYWYSYIQPWFHIILLAGLVIAIVVSGRTPNPPAPGGHFAGATGASGR